jgi:hypothetical protein
MFDQKYVIRQNLFIFNIDNLKKEFSMSAIQIPIFQKNWAFTSSESKQTQIITGAFGPCYMVSFTSGKFAAMAHIDDTTNVDSMQAIFNKFIENSVSLKDVKVVIVGGWKENSESFKWGMMIVNKILTSGFKKEMVSTKNMFSKKILTNLRISESEVSDYFHLGAIVDSKTGKTFILKEKNKDLADKQSELLQEFMKKYVKEDMEYPLTQVL